MTYLTVVPYAEQVIRVVDSLTLVNNINQTKLLVSQ